MNFINFFRVIVTLILIFFITFQTSLTYYNYVLEGVHSLGIFLNYPDAKRFVFRFTWGCIVLYIFLNVVVNLF
uniref:hypothetical chloroplast RF47 n=1 Tax=Kalinella pachyderma TaxID=2704665 RepID=UPI00241147C9|nr:hypothetical chloroplast RF47 [Kalinella pachyderma]WDY12909.1 hypothetical chloroplast RF47 [Kalinella pachyderma]